MNKIIAVMVTYNRLEKLKKTLDCLVNQTILPDKILIVNNNSNDGTDVFLANLQKQIQNIDIVVFNMSENLGGAGGFSVAFEEAMKFDFDYLYVGDDDAYLEKDGFERFNHFADNKNQDFGAVCGKVLENGEIATLHRRRVKKGFYSWKEYPVDDIEYNKDFFKIDLYSFVGTFIKKEALLICGLPNKEYFIWYDDTEHSARISNKYDIYCVPSIVINHDCAQAVKSLTWKNYYGYRNKLDLIKKNYTKRNYKYYRFMLKLSFFVDFFINRKKIKVKRDALKDDKKNILGISNVYKPGTKV